MTRGYYQSKQNGNIIFDQKIYMKQFGMNFSYKRLPRTLNIILYVVELISTLLTSHPNSYLDVLAPVSKRILPSLMVNFRMEYHFGVPSHVYGNVYRSMCHAGGFPCTDTG